MCAKDASEEWPGGTKSKQPTIGIFLSTNVHFPYLLGLKSKNEGDVQSVKSKINRSLNRDHLIILEFNLSASIRAG